MSFRKRDIPIERVIYLFIVIFNCLTIIFLYDYNSFIEVMIWADIWLIAIIKLEKVVSAFILTQKAFKGKKT